LKLSFFGILARYFVIKYITKWLALQLPWLGKIPTSEEIVG